VGQDIVFVTVSDTGTGMSREVIARAFEPFFTTKEVGKGSGLGLSMAYGFAEQSGGHISIKSQEGQGTSVTLMLRALTSSSAPPAPETEKPAPKGGKERVLVVEDEPRVLQFVSAQLVSLGYEVTAVSTGPDALSALKQGDRFDLLFTDVVLPKGMSGVELAEHARQIRPDIKVLLTSGYSEGVFQQQGTADGKGIPLLRKPYRRKALAEMLRNVLDPTAS
jgi:CheY-like chemotaxis protein